MKNIINIEDATLEHSAHGDNFEVLDAQLGPLVGAQKLGYSLCVLCVSTMIDTEVLEYPDSDKVAIYVGSAPGEAAEKRTFNHRGRLGLALDYWDGE